MSQSLHPAREYARLPIDERWERRKRAVAWNLSPQCKLIMARHGAGKLMGKLVLELPVSCPIIPERELRGGRSSQSSRAKGEMTGEASSDYLSS